MNFLKNINISNKYIGLSLFLILFFILEFEYYDFINIPLFQEKMGFRFEFIWWKFIIVKLLLAGLLYINFKLKDFNYFINSLFLIFLSFPVLILYEFMPKTPISISLFAILFHTLFWLSSLFKINMKNYVNLNQDTLKYGFIVLVLLMLIPFFITYGLKINFKAFLFFNDNYDIRAIAASKSNIITAYFLSWLIKIIIPIGIILSIKNKNYLISALFIIAQLYLFSIGAYKSAFFSLLVLLIMFIPKYKNQISFILFSFIILIILSKIISLTSGQIMPESIVVRRTFFLPAIIINDYFDFFSGHHVYLSHSIFRHFLEYKFDLQPPQLIGKYYFNNPDANVNSGFISDGFMNFGYIGVILNTLGLVFVFKLIQSLNITYIYSGVLLIMVYTFISSYFLTTLLTHGVIIFIVVSYLFLRNNTSLSK